MVNWNWDRKMGEITAVDERTKNKFNINLYEGNCLAVAIYEFQDSNQYQFMYFWNDIQHLKHCLGLTKQYKDNVYGDSIYKVKLNAYFKDCISMAKAFAKAGYTVELYYKEMN